MKNENLQMLKLMNKALKAFPNSKQQKLIIAELNELRKKHGLDEML